MKFGLILVCYPYSIKRAELATRVLTSIAKTNVKDIDCVLQIVYRETQIMSAEQYNSIIETLRKTFTVIQLSDADVGVHGQNAVSTASANRLLDSDSEVTHIVFMYDDWVVNSEWLQELNKLVQRHPGAIAWSIYRSALTRHHRIIGGDGTDVLMTMHDGLGCVTREEWNAYKAHHNGIDFSVPPDFELYGPGACTFDMHHAAKRPGNRWATSRDYWQNLDLHPNCPTDRAIDFVGE